MLSEKHLPVFLESDKKCRYCAQEITLSTAVPTHSYWRGILFFCHQDCKKPGETEERVTCQKIDADCNDCFFFKRGIMLGKGHYEGICSKFEKRVDAYPVFGTGHSCFEHRNDHKE